MVIEILYKDLTNIYGDIGNIKILEKNLPEAKFIYTEIKDTPYFVNNEVDMIYMGSFPDEYFDIILKSLSKYKSKLKELIEKNTLIMFTGTAFELCGAYFEENGNKKNTLSLFNNVHFICDKNKRHNSLFVGTFNNTKIVGNKSQFTFMYGDNKYPFITAKEGCMGMNKDSKYEGIHYKNFFGTQVLGPILILNPLFLKYILKKLSKKNKIYLEDLMIKAYNNRLNEFDKPGRRYILKDHG